YRQRNALHRFPTEAGELLGTELPLRRSPSGGLTRLYISIPNSFLSHGCRSSLGAIIQVVPHWRCMAQASRAFLRGDHPSASWSRHFSRGPDWRQSILGYDGEQDARPTPFACP